MRVHRDHKQNRAQGSRGATLVEYALLTALILGVSLVGVRALSASATDEVATTSDCVSQRPQPASCSASAVDVTSTTAAPVSSSSTTTTAPQAATTTTAAPPTTVAPTTTTTQAPTTTTTEAPTWSGEIKSFDTKKDKKNIKVSVEVEPSSGSVENLEVVFSYRFSNGTTGTKKCTTDEDGKCSTSFPTPKSWDTVVVTIDSIAGLAVSPPQTDTVRNG